MPAGCGSLCRQAGLLSAALAGIAFFSPPLRAAEELVEEVVVSGRALNLVGAASSASEGVVGQAELQLRPLLRTGEIMEAVPGLVATQHSGTGKANQYFLRGFNLDHGTDFATSFGPMPVNMRSHGHGQGYTDLNFVIPELVERIDYRKGPYHAEVGDFGSAGAATLTPMSRLPATRAEIGAGGNGYQRALAMGSSPAAGGDLLLALEAQRYDGPWTDIREDLDKRNAVLRWSLPVAGGTLAVMGMAYDADWNSADQIPARAVTAGLIDERGSIDTTVGGTSSRYSLSAEWDRDRWHADLWAIDYDLSLWSNFTYLLDDPVDGDQFLQVDARRLYGGELTHLRRARLGEAELASTIGLQFRYDDIADVGLWRSRSRERLGAIRRDAVQEASAAVFLENRLQWGERWRAEIGLRVDHFGFDVSDRAGINANGVDLRGNSGRTEDSIPSLRGNVVYSVDRALEFYAAAGQGFHSNDARGTTSRVDPSDGNPVTPVDPLVRSRGAETGVRFFADGGLSATASVWWLALDSETLFIGDAGNTEAGRASARKGLELTGTWRFAPYWSFDLEYARTDTRFSEDDPADPAIGDAVPGAVDDVLSLGFSTRQPSGLFGGLRLRYVGPRPLDEQDDVRSGSALSLNLRAGYDIGNLRLAIDVLNLADSKDQDIAYFYASRLPGESAPVDDIHYHVMEPRTARVSVSLDF